MNVDDSVFSSQAHKNAENTSENNKKTGGKQKKNKKGQDFLEYAKNNGIDVKIQYDEGERNKSNYENRKYDNNQGNKGSYQNNKNFGAKKFYPGNQTNEGEDNSTNQSKGNDYHQNRKNFGGHQNNYNKKGYNPQTGKNFHTVNKFDSFNAPQFQGTPNTGMGYYPYNQQGNMMQNVPNSNTSRNFNQNTQVDKEGEVDMNSFILSSLEYYFSEKNLNNNYYMRVKLDPEGYLNTTDLVSFNRMKQNGVTVDKVQETLENNSIPENIEIRTGSEGQLFIRYKYFDDVRDRLTPVEVLQQRRNYKKFNNNNINPYFQNFNNVGMQNNYFYQMNQHQFDPNMMNQQMMAGYGMGMNPGYFQYSQMPGYDMKMMGYNMYQGHMTGKPMTDNTENINN